MPFLTCGTMTNAVSSAVLAALTAYGLDAGAVL